jgi:hypothetical protein
MKDSDVSHHLLCDLRVLLCGILSRLMATERVVGFFG